MRWHLSRDRQLLVRSWDGESVVYDCAAGDTHLLGVEAAAAFAQLQQGPCEQRAQDVANENSEQGEQGICGGLDAAIVARLVELGLVESAA